MAWIDTDLKMAKLLAGKISLDSYNDLTKYLLTSLAISPYHNDSYIIQAYDAILPPQAIITLPAVLPLSPVLSLPLMFDSRDFFSSEKISPPKDTETPVKSPILVSPSSSPVRLTTSPPDYPFDELSKWSRNCTEDCKVKFATGTLTEEALSWWNYFSQSIGIEEAYKITWVKFKKLLIKKYYLRAEIQKMKDKFYHLTVKGNDLKTYVRRFQELATVSATMVSDSKKLLEAFIRGLPRSIKGNVTASKP
nr:reverse transcriptase domain-containing protein [Tanacetum cinerariifolium]